MHLFGLHISSILTVILIANAADLSYLSVQSSIYLKIFGSNCNLCVKQLSFSKYTTTMNLKPNFDLPLVRGVTHDLPVWMPMMLSQFMIGNIRFSGSKYSDSVSKYIFQYHISLTRFHS